ncbi:MAG: sigma-70 family RNA polymerase sigma factor [Planctomycetota bacterium]
MARTDDEFVLKTLAGDQDAFSKLIKRHRRIILMLALQCGFQPAEAEDVTQNVFIKAFGSLPHLHDPKSFARWLYGIASHVIADAARARNLRGDVAAFDRASKATASTSEEHERLLETTETLRAISALPEDQRLTLTLRYLHGLTPKDIAQRLGQPRGTIRSQLHQALSSLLLGQSETLAPTPNSSENKSEDGISCEQSLRQIERMVEEDDLKSGERVLLFTHLKSCESCKTVMNQIRYLESRIKQALFSVDISADFNQRVMAALPPMDRTNQPSAELKGIKLLGKKSTRLTNIAARRSQISFF